MHNHVALQRQNIVSVFTVSRGIIFMLRGVTAAVVRSKHRCSHRSMYTFAVLQFALHGFSALILNT